MATSDSHGLFWDSDNGDRVYNAESFETWLKKFFTTGVFANELYVSASSGMTVSVSSGYCNVDGKVKFFGTSTLTLQAANSTYPRYDTIVIERDDVGRDITIKVVTGAYSGDTPVPTAPIRSGGIYQIVLAQIYVEAGITEITQSNITDTRTDLDLCGLVTGTVDSFDFEQFTEQYESYFREWFATLVDVLDKDTAGHLQNEINAINAKIYPVGSIYISVNNTNPSTIFGGTWQSLTNVFLMSYSEVDTNTEYFVPKANDAITANSLKVYMWKRIA